MPSCHPIGPSRKVFNRERAIQSGQCIVWIIDRDTMALHKGMHTALHRNLPPYTGEFDHIGRSRLCQRWTMEHNEYMFIVPLDRKSTRLNSSHGYISYAVFCL